MNILYCIISTKIAFLRKIFSQPTLTNANDWFLTRYLVQIITFETAMVGIKFKFEKSSTFKKFMDLNSMYVHIFILNGKI